MVAASHLLPWLFPRLLGVVYFLAFVSLAVQVAGLYGSKGILPVCAYLGELRSRFGPGGWRYCPTLFWLRCDDRLLAWGAILGAALALLLVAGVFPVPLLVLLWLLYLSYAAAGQEFLSYQWDALLLETGFMTIFLPLAQPAPPLVVFACCFFLFRFMFSAGVVKLTSGDPNWRNLSALRYHYETQPLPNIVAWYAHQLPPWMQKLSALGTFFFEILVPFLALGPAPVRLAGFLLLLFFQLLIFATGNYGFFNLLTMVLLVPLVDDRYFRLVTGYPPLAAQAGDDPLSLAAGAIFALFIALNLCQLLRLFYRPSWLGSLLAPLYPAMISNPYGLFAVMTTNRFEFVVEGSDDLKEWRTYEFRWKPGDPHRPPRQAAPHQPRLDWQMWFAALDPRTIEPWLVNLMVRLLEGSPPVLALLGHNPFPDAPPRHVRLILYRYHFSTLKGRRAHGRWWDRSLLGQSEPLSLQGR